MRRIVNLRTMLVVALCEIAMILALLLSERYVFAGILLATLLCLTLSVIGIVSFKISLKACIAAFVALAVCIFTCVSFEVRLHTYYDISPESDVTYRVEGAVESVTEDEGMVQYAVLSDVRVDSRKVRGNVRVVLADSVAETSLPIGCKMTVTGCLYVIRLIDGMQVNGSSYRNNLRYVLYASSENFVLEDAKVGFLVGIRTKLYHKLRQACGEEYGSIAYCMLTGDKNELGERTYRIYSMSGIGHVLAVSGLHVGILSVLLLWILRKLHVPKLPRILIVSIALVVYAVFVGMPASVVRSIIMCVIAMLVLLHGRQKDTLSALCLACSVILLAEPFLLFEVGFLMSFGAVYGLTLFSRTFDKAFHRIHFPGWIAKPLSATMSVHLGILPTTAYFFHSIPTYSMLFNILLLPIVSLTFTVLVIVLPIALLCRFDLLLRICVSGFAFSDAIVGIVSYLPGNSVYIYGHATLFLLYPLYFLIGKFFLLPQKHKCLVSSGISLLCCILAIVPTLATYRMPKEIRYSVIPVNSYGDVTSVIVDDQVTVLGDVKDTVALKTVLEANRIRKIDVIILNRLTESIGKNLAAFVHDYHVGKIVCTVEGTEVAGISALGGYKRLYMYEDAELSRVTPVFAGNRQAGYLYEFSSQISLLSVGYSSRYSILSDEICNRAPIIRCFMYLNEKPDRIYLTNMPTAYLGAVPYKQFGLADYGTYIYKVFSGEVLGYKVV